MGAVDPQHQAAVAAECDRFFSQEHMYTQADGEQRSTTISVTVGLCDSSTVTGLPEDPFLRVKFLEERASNVVSKQKLRVIEQETRERVAKLIENGMVFGTLDEEVRFNLEVFIDEIAETWGSVRVSEQAFVSLFEFIFARMIENILAPYSISRRVGKRLHQSFVGAPNDTVKSSKPLDGFKQKTAAALREETYSAGTNDLTDSLKKVTKNECPVTGIPFEIPELRSKGANFIETALPNDEVVLLYQMDLDKLNQLNANFTREEVDEMIKNHFTKMKEYLGRINGIKFMMYRPQAGGDEMKFVIKIDMARVKKLYGNVIEGTRKLLSIVDRVLTHTYVQVAKYNEMNQETTIFEVSGSVAYAHTTETVPYEEFDTGFKVLQEMELISDQRLTAVKFNKIMRRITDNLELGIQGKEGIEDFLRYVAADWGSTRMKPEALRILLYCMNAALIKRYMIGAQTSVSFGR